jgi:hypothetical protein
MIIFCQNNTRDANRRPTKKPKSKGECTMEYKWARLLEVKCLHNQLYHKICLLFFKTKLCPWNKYFKISINKCWKLAIP